MNNEIDDLIYACEKCQYNKNSQQKEPLMQEPMPSRVFEQVSIDFFSCSGENFLLYTDRLSGWPVVFKFKRGETTSRNVIDACRPCFIDLGIPVILRSDNGPQFTASEFKDFLGRWDVRHIKSTPYYPQSNGLVEAAVKSMKKLVITSTENGNIGTEEFSKALLEWRNTPRNGGLSPAETVFGYQLRSSLPIHHSAFDKKWQTKRSDYDRRCLNDRNKAKKYYDEKSKPLRKIEIGTKVRIQNQVNKKWDKIGTVVEFGKYCNYLIMTPSGKTLWRNRRYIST